MNKTKSILLLLSLSLIGQAQSAPVTVTPSSTVLMKRITPAQLSGGSSGITTYSDQCTARTATWSAGGTCSAPTTALSNGASQTVSSTNTNSGSATFVCDGSGNRLVLQPGSTCSDALAGATSPCSSQTVNWGSCSATAAGRNHNQSVAVTDSTSPTTGSATFTCNDGSFIYDSGNCSSPSTTCTSKTLNWSASGNNCASVSGVTNDGANKTLSNTLANGNTGSATFSCSAGSDSYSIVGSPTCAPPAPTACTSQTLNWSASGNSCSALSGTTNDGSAKTVSNTASNGNTGSATFSCSAGSDTYSIVGSPTCAPPAPTACTSKALNWSSGGNSCSALSGTTNDGAAKTVTNTASNGNTGSATYVCNASSDTYTVSGTPSCSAAPAVSGYKYVSSASTSCAITGSDTLKCWGLNNFGQVGTGNTQNSFSPNPIIGPTGVVNVLSGGHSTFILTNQGKVYSWGYNGQGQLGNGTTTNSSSPPSTEILSQVLSIDQDTVFGSTTCALRTTGALFCWGQNAFGKVGDGTTTNRSTPTPVVGLDSGVREYVIGENHSCAITDIGALKCWGLNNFGGLGDGTTTDRTVPTQVIGLTSGVKSVAISSFSTCALLENGSVRCWGQNDFGQIGDGTTTDRTVPTQVTGLTSGVKFIGKGPSHACALLSTNQVSCWGRNQDGEIGDSSFNVQNFRSSPRAVSGQPSSVIALVVNVGGGCIISNLGAVSCWGNNQRGHIGDGTTTNRKIATQVSGLTTGFSKIFYRGGGFCAPKNTGSMFCWGPNLYGQHGNNQSVDKLTPSELP